MLLIIYHLTTKKSSKLSNVPPKHKTPENRFTANASAFSSKTIFYRPIAFVNSHTIIGCFLQYARFHRDTIIHGGICVYTQVIEHIHIAIGMPHTGNCITSQSYSSWWPGLKHNTIYHQTRHYIPSNTILYTIKHNTILSNTLLHH